MQFFCQTVNADALQVSISTPIQTASLATHHAGHAQEQQALNVQSATIMPFWPAQHQTHAHV